MTRLLQAIGLLPKPIDWAAWLEEDRQRRLQSFEVQDYAKRRQAALKGLGRA